jgi:hypothetical protein
VRKEQARRRTGAEPDDRYALELFRRAVAERDDAAWAMLFDLYNGMVAAWCVRAGGGGRYQFDELAAQTWERFWHGFTPSKFAQAGNLGAVLRYLRLCAVSAVIDEARKESAALLREPMTDDVVDSAPTPSDVVIDRAGQAALWRTIQGQLHGETERVLVQLLYELGYRPAEVQAHRPDLFPSVQDVYRLTRNVLDRLRRCSELRRWHEDFGTSQVWRSA